MERTADYVQTQLLRDVSRTFALSIEQLPKMLREPVSVAYLMLRVSDILEDHQELPAEQKANLLRAWAGILDGKGPVTDLTNQIKDLDGSDPEVWVAQNAHLILERLDALPSPVRLSILTKVKRTTLGMARWQEHGPYVEDEPALDDYMHEVAGRVGYLVTDLFAWYAPEIDRIKDTLMPLSRQCGLALQTVNVIRGIPKDYQRGWVFVPETFYRQVGLSRDELLDPANLDGAMEVVAMLADKADRHLKQGLAYVTSFPRRFHNIRLALMWPYLFAVRTLAISRNNPNVLLSEAKMERSEVKRIVVQSKLMGWSNHWLSYYQKRLSRPLSG